MSKTLIVYFSRTGEQYSVGNITKGNTAIVAEIIAEKTDGDLFEIKVVNDNYPNEYTPLIQFAKKEKQENARPEIIGISDIVMYLFNWSKAAVVPERLALTIADAGLCLK